MGNKNSNPNKQQSAISSQARLILHLRSRTVIVHHSYKMKLQLSDVALFPHGLDGLKLWETDIIASRYIVINNRLFEGKEILTINSGVGICGISMKKWTQASNVVMGQFHQEVVQNIKRNCQKNDVKEMTAFRLDWNQIEKYVAKYDIVFGADVFYNGSPYKQLFQLLKRFLKVGGEGVFVVPEKEDSRHLFFKLIQTVQQQHNSQQDNQARRSSQLKASKDQSPVKQKGTNYDEFYFEVKKQPKLVHEEYFLSPLPNKVEGMDEFPMLSSLDFAVYRIIKRKRDTLLEKQQLTEEINQSLVLQEKAYQKVQNQSQKVQKVHQQTNLQDIKTNETTQEAKDSEEQKVKTKIEELKKQVETQQQKNIAEHKGTQENVDQSKENAYNEDKQPQQSTEPAKQSPDEDKTQHTQQYDQKDTKSAEPKTEEPVSHQQTEQINCKKPNQPKQQQLQHQACQEKAEETESCSKQQEKEIKPNEFTPQQEAQHKEEKDEQGDEQQETIQKEGGIYQQSSQNKREDQEQTNQAQTTTKKNKKKRKR